MQNRVQSTLYESMIYSVYFAPRGRERLLSLGDMLAQRHLNYRDKLVGIVGDAGSGKSLIIKGMFPGLSLSNDDDSIDAALFMQIKNNLDSDFKFMTYHMDMRFQMAFTQMYEIVDFVNGALQNNRRVIIEHFDLLYPFLKKNADIIIGIGEEIIVTRPNIFGPVPKDIYNIVFNSLKNRKMAHTAEDLTMLVLKNHFGIKFKVSNSDVRSGFVLAFKEKPEIDLNILENQVKSMIDQGLDVSYSGEDKIKIGEDVIKCTGPRIHVRNTKDISDLHILKEFKYDEKSELYCLIGIVGKKTIDADNLNRVIL